MVCPRGDEQTAADRPYDRVAVEPTGVIEEGKSSVAAHAPHAVVYGTAANLDGSGATFCQAGGLTASSSAAGAGVESAAYAFNASRRMLHSKVAFGRSASILVNCCTA